MSTMIGNPKDFYRAYQKDYHKIKATYLKKMIDNVAKYETAFFELPFEKVESDDFRTALKSDLRQTYFHAIETLFELIFALIPKNNLSFELTLQFRLTYSNWNETYKKIKEIAENESSLNFLDEFIELEKAPEKITVGEFLFYIGISKEMKLKPKFTESINSIKKALRIMARDFTDREEYNAYKHGLRIIPSMSKFTLIPFEQGIEKLEFDVSDSMSFYTKMRDPEEIRVITKVFDSDRDYRMTCLCSNLIHQVIFYRRIIMNLSIDKGKFSNVGYYFYKKQNISDFSKTDVKVQDMEYTLTKVKD